MIATISRARLRLPALLVAAVVALVVSVVGTAAHAEYQGGPFPIAASDAATSDGLIDVAGAADHVHDAGLGEPSAYPMWRYADDPTGEWTLMLGITTSAGDPWTVSDLTTEQHADGTRSHYTGLLRWDVDNVSVDTSRDIELKFMWKWSGSGTWFHSESVNVDLSNVA